MDLRFMRISKDEIIVRFNLTDLADMFFVYEFAVESSSQKELSDALRDVLYQCDPVRFAYLAPDVDS